MGKASKRKGNRIEAEIVNLHRDLGVPAVRVPLSGSAGGEFAGDLHIAGSLVAEVKARGGGQGFLTLERWLGDHDILFLRRDREKPLAVLPWRTYARMITALVKDIKIDEADRMLNEWDSGGMPLLDPIEDDASGKLR